MKSAGRARGAGGERVIQLRPRASHQQIKEARSTLSQCGRKLELSPKGVNADPDTRSTLPAGQHEPCKLWVTE